jgi:hypothetical protein
MGEPGRAAPRPGVATGRDIGTECNHYGSHRDQQLLRSGYGHAVPKAARQVTGSSPEVREAGKRGVRKKVTATGPAPPRLRTGRG